MHKITGKWLVPKAELDRWLALIVQRPPVCSADNLCESSAAVTIRCSNGRCARAARAWGASQRAAKQASSGSSRESRSQQPFICIPVEDAEADANIAAVGARGDLQDAVLIGFCRREQELLVAKGNPLKIASIAEVIGKRARHSGRKVPVRSFWCSRC